MLIVSLTHGISLECTLEYEYLTRIPTLEHRYSAESNMGYKLHRALALDECDVRPVSGAPNQFTLLSTKKSFDIICSNSNMRDRWFKALKRCIEESRENSHMERVTKYAAPWNPDEMTMHCMLCKSKFTKVFNRKHHCRSCGKVICGSCGKYVLFDEFERMSSIDRCYHRPMLPTLKTPTGTKEYFNKFRRNQSVSV